MSANNKQIVTEAYQRIFGDLDVSAVDEFMSKDFVQHNPTTPDGPEGVKQVVQMLVSQGVPKQKFEYKHVIVDDDIVILHTPTRWREKNGDLSISIASRTANWSRTGMP